MTAITNQHAKVWRKSSYTGAGANCVETSPTVTGIGIRDSKAPEMPYIDLSKAAFAHLIAAVKNGQLDL